MAAREDRGSAAIDTVVRGTCRVLCRVRRAPALAAPPRPTAGPGYRSAASNRRTRPVHDCRHDRTHWGDGHYPSYVQNTKRHLANAPRLEQYGKPWGQTAAGPGPAWPARSRIAAEFECEARAVSMGQGKSAPSCHDRRGGNICDSLSHPYEGNRNHQSGINTNAFLTQTPTLF